MNGSVFGLMGLATLLVAGCPNHAPLGEATGAGGVGGSGGLGVGGQTVGGQGVGGQGGTTGLATSTTATGQGGATGASTIEAASSTDVSTASVTGAGGA